jgi:hypothetical protein
MKIKKRKKRQPKSAGKNKIYLEIVYWTLKFTDLLIDLLHSIFYHDDKKFRSKSYS